MFRSLSCLHFFDMATFAAGKSSLILAKSSNILRYSSVGLCGLSYQRIHAVCRNNFPNYPYTQFVRLIQSQETPNPNSIKLLVGRVILSKGAIDFPNVRSADKSPLAKKLFDISGVKGVYFGHDFVTVTKDNEDLDWQNLKPQIIDAIKDFLSSGLPVLSDDVKISDEESLLHEKEDETVLLIKELIETRIRPTVQDDGGDIVFKGFEEGVVKVKLQGSCTSCPSSSVTLKRGVQNMLQFYVPEVMGVLQVEDEEDDMSKQEFERFEKSLEEQKTVK